MHMVSYTLLFEACSCTHLTLTSNKRMWSSHNMQSYTTFKNLLSSWNNFLNWCHVIYQWTVPKQVEAWENYTFMACLMHSHCLLLEHWKVILSARQSIFIRIKSFLLIDTSRTKETLRKPPYWEGWCFVSLMMLRQATLLIIVLRDIWLYCSQPS